MVVIILLILIIAALVLWIYYTGGGTLRTRELTQRISELEEENETLRKLNRTIRSGFESSSEKISRPVIKASNLIESLIRVKEALKGSKTAKQFLENKYENEIGQGLIQEILASVEGISMPVRRRLAHEILVGDIGKDMLRSIKEGDSVTDAAANAGVPLRIGKERVRILKETGYLDNKLNLTDWGVEALEL